MKKFSIGLVALVAAVLMAVPALAQPEYSLYGQIRFQTFYEVDEPEGAGSDTDLTWDNAANARVGANITLGDTAFRWELSNSGGTRLLYGTWNFGQGTLLIGQTYTPYTWFADQVHDSDNGLVGYGATWDNRQPMIQVKMDNGFYLSAIKPHVDSAASDTILPKLALGYDGAVDGFAYGAGVAFQTFDLEATNDSVDSWMLYHHGKLDMQPFEILYNLHLGQNVGGGTDDTLGLGLRNRIGYVNGEDTDSYGAFAQVGYTLTETSRLHVGAGYTVDDNDAAADEVEKFSAFVNTEIFLAKNFFVVPEVSYYDNDAAGELWAFGAKWQMNF